MLFYGVYLKCFVPLIKWHDSRFRNDKLNGFDMKSAETLDIKIHYLLSGGLASYKLFTIYSNELKFSIFGWRFGGHNKKYA